MNAGEPQSVGPHATSDESGMMSFGEHLEELRSCSIRALVGFALSCMVSLLFARKIMALVLRPALIVLDAHGQRAQIQALSPPDTFITWLKMAFIAGLIIAMPWILMQIWRFVAVGLYQREQRFLTLFTPVSISLFLTGVVFMYYIVLPVVLNFFVVFGERVVVTDLQPSGLQQMLMGTSNEPEDDEPAPLAADLPMRQTDPADAPLGSMWINERRGVLCVQTERGLFSVPMQRSDRAAAVRSEFGLNYYISFVLSLSLAFGLAFQVPLVVLFLATTGIVPLDQLRRSRRYVIFGIFVAAAILTPPDVISQLLLAIPMLILFEGALLVARFTAGQQVETESP